LEYRREGREWREGRREEEEEEGEGVDIVPSHAPIRCRGKRASCSIAGVIKEAFNSRWVTWIRALKGLGIRSTDRYTKGASSHLSGKVSSRKALRPHAIAVRTAF
jgi:hypothetical protein